MENHRFISFISHLTRIIIVHKMMSNIFKKLACMFCILFTFSYKKVHSHYNRFYQKNDHSSKVFLIYITVFLTDVDKLVFFFSL